MAKKALDQEAVLNGIRAGGREQEKWMGKIFDHHYSLIYKAIQKHKISEEQARDAYSDAIITFRQLVLDGTFREEANYFSFLYRIFFNKIFNALQKNQTKKDKWVFVLPAHLKKVDFDIEKHLENEESVQRLIKWMDQLKEPCAQILLDSAYWGYSMEEVAERLQLKDAATARSKKFHCLKKLQKLISSTTDKN